MELIAEVAACSSRSACAIGPAGTPSPYLDARPLRDLAPTLAALPAIGIDHLGLHADGLVHLLPLATGAASSPPRFVRADLDVPTGTRDDRKDTP